MPRGAGRAEEEEEAEDEEEENAEEETEVAREEEEKAVAEDAPHPLKAECRPRPPFCLPPDLGTGKMEPPACTWERRPSLPHSKSLRVSSKYWARSPAQKLRKLLRPAGGSGKTAFSSRKRSAISVSTIWRGSQVAAIAG